MKVTRIETMVLELTSKEFDDLIDAVDFALSSQGSHCDTTEVARWRQLAADMRQRFKE